MVRTSIAAFTALAFVGAPASAVTVLGSLTGGTAMADGGVLLINPAPPAVIGSGLFGDSNVRVFDEVKTFLPEDVVVQGPVTIPTGTFIESHLVVFDPGPWRTVTGTLEFDGFVVGIVGRTTPTWVYVDTINSTTPFLGSPGLTYGFLEGIEGADFITISGKKITFSLSSGGTSDAFRVLTVIPEPMTWAMLIVGFGLVGVASRRRSGTRTA